MAKQLFSRYNAVEKTFDQLDYSAYLVHCHWMNYALELAQIAGEKGEIPVGAIIVDSQGNLLSKAANKKEENHDATAHAEIEAIRSASRVKQNWCLQDCTLYVTLEPCAMCAGAIIQSRLSLLVYGADEPKSGAIRTVMNLPDSECSYHQLQVLAGIKESSCRQQLQTWFSRQRNKSK